MNLEDHLFSVVRAAISAHPRSLQKRIGPSEIGKPCDRWMLRKLAGVEEPERGPAWKPAIGTAMHAQLEEWFDAANRGGGDVENTEWVTEWEVNVGRIGDTDITGHSDLFHVPTGTVIDWKVVGARQLAKYRLHGPSEQYRVQAHLYGRGFTNDGGWGPCREVAIAFLPRDGELHQAYFWHEPFNPHLALEALARANRLWALLQVVGLDAALATKPLCDDQWCSFCKADRAVLRAEGRISLFDDTAEGWRSLFVDTTAGPVAVVSQPEPEPAPIPMPTRSPERLALCRACGAPLSPAAIADGFSTHPTCADPQAPVAAPRPVPSTPQPAALAPITNLFDR
ncbi:MULTISPECIES: hypothetical protein [unclassified Microbacterium]|uniref:hypothetical protein n=1 Tax=Microbacterium TaxID=33882 RepID=UPI003BA16A76